MEIKIIKKNSELSHKSFQELRHKLLQEEKEDEHFRGKYGQQWKRPPSNVIQKPYRNQIDGNHIIMLSVWREGQASRPSELKVD